MARSRRKSKPSHDRFFRDLAHDFAEHRLFIYATSIGFRALVALIPLALLARRACHPSAGDATCLSRNRLHGREDPLVGTAGLIIFAGALVLWDLMLAIVAIVEALNRIHDVENTRPFGVRVLTAVGLAILSAVCLIGSFLILTVAPRARGDVTHFVLGVGPRLWSAGQPRSASRGVVAPGDAPPRAILRPASLT